MPRPLLIVLWVLYITGLATLIGVIVRQAIKNPCWKQDRPTGSPSSEGEPRV